MIRIAVLGLASLVGGFFVGIGVVVFVAALVVFAAVALEAATGGGGEG